jgi:hypothetical protein
MVRLKRSALLFGILWSNTAPYFAEGLSMELDMRRFTACLSDGDQFRIGVCTLKRLRRTGALARVLARQELQITPRVLIRRMPEKGRRPAGRALADTIDFIAGRAQERERLSGCGAHVPRFGRRGLEGSVIAGLTNRQDKEKVAQSHWRRG